MNALAKTAEMGINRQTVNKNSNEMAKGPFLQWRCWRLLASHFEYLPHSRYRWRKSPISPQSPVSKGRNVFRHYRQPSGQNGQSPRGHFWHPIKSPEACDFSLLHAFLDLSVKICYDHVLTSGLPWQHNDAITFFTCLCISRYKEFLSEIA